jgi:ribosomal protein S18 acetylase RimI-like enzyme
VSEQAPFQLRKATVADAGAILACLAAAFEEYRSQYTPPAFADTILDADTIQVRMRRMRVFVAESGGEIVGTIGCSANRIEGHIRGMAILPDRQGSGVAGALLHAAEVELFNNGCSYVALDTTQPLARAIRFYEKHGYRATGRVCDFFGMPLYEYSKSLRKLPGVVG